MRAFILGVVAALGLSMGVAAPALAVPTQPQSITLTAFPNPATVGGPGILLATSTSSLFVATVVDPASDPGVCTLTGSIISYFAAGTCKITGVQPGDDTYLPAEPQTLSIPVTLPGGTKLPQTITFEPPPTAAAPSVLVPIATSTSGLPVTIAVDPTSDPGVCSLLGTSLFVSAAGTCRLVASQIGDALYDPAPLVMRSIIVTSSGANLPQTISFDPPAAAIAPGLVPLTATSTSGLPVFFAVDPTSDPGVCSIGGPFAVLNLAGTCRIVATQPGAAGLPGSLGWDPAPPVIKSIAVSGGLSHVVPVITFDPPAAGTVGGSDVLTATSSVAIPPAAPIVFAVDPTSDPGVCSLAGNVVSYLLPGTCKITATEAGDGVLIDPAVPVTKSIVVTGVPKLPQTITFDPPASGSVGGSDALTASSTSTLTVALAVDPSSDAGVCSLTGNTVSYQGAGTCKITATQPGNATFDPATPVTKSIVVSAAPTDSDGDGIVDGSDNCVDTANSSQEDSDADGVGNSCDNCPTDVNGPQDDSDNDGIGNVCDNCPNEDNPAQEDTDGNDVGDACEPGSSSDFTTGPTATISGTLRQGQTLTAGEGTPVPSQDSFEYQWLADGADIGGATHKTFTLTSAQVGTKISVTVTAIKTGFNAASDTSNETGPVQGIFSPGPTAKITGTVRTGATLTASAGSPSPSPTATGYKWAANGKTISGAVSKTFKLTSAQAGKRITVKVTIKRANYLTASDDSSATATVSALQAKQLLVDPDEDSVRRGQKVAPVELRKMSSGESWTLYFDSTKIGSGKADRDGKANTSMTVPTKAKVGKHTLRLVGRFSDRTGTHTLQVR